MPDLSGYTRWELDYDLTQYPLHGLFYEYLEMGNNYALGVTYKIQYPTSKTLGRMGTNSGRSDFWDRLGGQALVMIGRWYSKESLTDHR